MLQPASYIDTRTVGELPQVAIDLLQKLIAIPSMSGQEDGTAACLQEFFNQRHISTSRKQNNVWAKNRWFTPAKPSILLNSHHDTVKPNHSYTRDPFLPLVLDGKLYGLGSNDAGGALVSMIATFLHFYEATDLSYNLILAATAEEETSGRNGIEAILPDLGRIDFAIVGEPTLMQPAIAEKGLMVLDCTSKGRSGHAAREEGDNAIYKAIDDIQWFRNFRFPRQSEWLGPVKMTVTLINAGSQHNVIPDNCNFTVDIRSTDAYSHEELLATIEKNVKSDVKARSLRLRPSFIPPDHPFISLAITEGLKPYGSPTTSDQALIPFPSVKMGPGDSARSHTADEFIYLNEIEAGTALYIRLLDQIFHQ